jgi:TolB-like protein/class 3 adenylate cyclase
LAEDHIQRRLVAILAADVVGYSRLMEKDETGTLAALKVRRRDIFTPLMAKHRGRAVRWMGDGVLVEFSSAIDAMQCGIDLIGGFEAANREVPASGHIFLRIGINLGDVILEGNDLYGEGVNVAARLEALAEAGGICISQNVYDQVRKKVQAVFEELGPQTFKNMSEPVIAWRVRSRSETAFQSLADSANSALPPQPSIAILPFATMSTDPDQETFADGLTEDLITDLSRNTGLLVIARNSTFAYKGKSVDVRRIANDLGVRYVLEGSARRASGRVRINVQLIDATSGNHMWAERYDRSFEDVFSVQDEVTAKIVEALSGRIGSWQPRNRPKSLEAWECCVKARKLMEESPQAWRESQMLIDRALELDPDYAEAHRWQAMNLWIGWAHWGEPEDPTRRLALEHADRAVALDPNDPGCRWIRGLILHYERRFEEAEVENNRSLELDPNHADTWAEKSDLSVLNGKLNEGLESIEKAFRLNPIPPSWYYLLKGQALYALRRYGAAVQVLRLDATYRTHSRRFLAASLAQLGRLDEARREAKMFLVINPSFRISFWAKSQPFKDEALLDHFVDGFRKAGLPE